MNMTPPTRVSPIHDLLQQYRPEWRESGDARIAWRYDSAASEGDAVLTLGLCDLSPLAKFGLKGPNALVWLQERGVSVPNLVLDSHQYDDGGWIVRLGSDEFLLENGFNSELIQQLDADLGEGAPGVTRIERQESTFQITGSRAIDILTQTCAVNFQEESTNQLFMTRVAGVNCGVLREESDEFPRYRLWVDSSYAVSLWISLKQISEELGGHLVGASASCGIE